MLSDLSASSSLRISSHYGPFMMFYFLKLGLLTQLSLSHFLRLLDLFIFFPFIFGCMGNVHTQLIIASTTLEWSRGMIIRQQLLNLYIITHTVWFSPYMILYHAYEAERLNGRSLCTHDGRFVPHSVSLSVLWNVKFVSTSSIFRISLNQV